MTNVQRRGVVTCLEAGLAFYCIGDVLASSSSGAFGDLELMVERLKDAVHVAERKRRCL